MGFTVKQLEELKAKGLIRDYKSQEKTPTPSENKPATKKKGEKIKGWIQLELEHWCDANRLELKKEFMFEPERQWRFDWCIPLKKIAIEYEGLNSKKNGHTTKKGFTDNTEKYNEAAAQGWKVMRYTFLNYKDLSRDLAKLLL